AWLEIRRRVEALRLTGDRRPVTGAEALAGLEQLLDDVTFAPERPPAPVQVMGYLETTGLQFTHLWITGLDDQTWPQLPNPNPFVPAELRRRHGVARSTPSEEADFAAERLRHWRHSAQQLIVSHARQSAGSELRPSPLIRDYPEVRLTDLHPQRAHPGFAHGDGRIEWIQDTSGAPLPGGRHRGGTGRFRDQALCPMRGYAIHRLRLDETRTPHGLPDALDRGTLVHEALHRLYEICREGIRNPSELTREDLEHAADRALARHYARFPVPFKTRERQRLVALLAAWNALECERDGVVIEALELDTHAEFDQIGLRLRIDRMDRIQGDLVVIDYKTGQVGNRLNQDRLIDPQLPLYALSNPDIRGVLYAQVDEQQPRLKGIAAMNLDQRGIEPPMGDSWETQLDRWRGQIDTLTREVREGVASVTPYSKEVCRNCHLQSFCRVSLEADAEDER
ncbi:MAG TPA: PD-(D/E)XK nuclease family protein, partial [Pseudomonadales bacterium]